MTLYNHPLYYKPDSGRPARSGLDSYTTPRLIQVQCVYMAEICVRIDGKWYAHTDGFYPITPEHVAVLEKWYEDNHA